MLSARLLAALRALLASATIAGRVSVSESTAGTAVVAQGDVARPAARRAAGTVAQAGPAARSPSQLRDPSARSGDGHPGDSGLARPPVVAHDRALPAGLAETRRDRAEPARRVVAGGAVPRVATSWRAPCAPAAVLPLRVRGDSTWPRSFGPTERRCASSRRSLASNGTPSVRSPSVGRPPWAAMSTCARAAGSSDLPPTRVATGTVRSARASPRPVGSGDTPDDRCTPPNPVARLREATLR